MEESELKRKSTGSEIAGSATAGQVVQAKYSRNLAFEC